MPGLQIVVLLVIALTCANGGTLDSDSEESFVEMPSNGTYVTVGSELALNCSLSQSYTGVLDSSYLYFNYTSEYPTIAEYILDHRTRQLKIPRVQISDAGVYHCYLNETSVGGRQKSLRSTATVIVHVGEPPTPVTTVSCVSDNFESMTCSWCPAVMPATPTRWQLHWAIGKILSGDRPGSVAEQCVCLFCMMECPDGLAESFVTFVPITLHFTAINNFGTARSQVVVDVTPRLVKPGPLRDLAVDFKNSTSMVISWLFPRYLDPEWFDLTYEIEWRSRWDGKQEIVREQLNDLHPVNLNDLHPATAYNVTVHCRPTSGEHWSDTVSIEVITDEDDPSSPPTILPGSFRVLPSTTNMLSSRDVVVFWQPIPERNQNGAILGYEVSYRTKEDSLPAFQPVPTSELSATVSHLDDRRGYVISVRAYNGAGQSPTATLYVPESVNSFAPPGNVVAERCGDIITFTWDPVTYQVSNYTLFWCEGLADVNDVCLGRLDHQIIPGDATTYVHKVTDDTHVYALAANSDAGSSGMSEHWLCVYDYDGSPGKPVFSFEPVTDARSVSLSWQPLSCSTKNRVRVLNYTLELFTDGIEERLRVVTLPGNVTSYAVTELTPDTNYRIKMAAQGHSGFGESYEGHIRTLESRPDDPPLSLSGRINNNKEIVLSWRRSPTPNGVITSYQVLARVNQTESWSMSVNGTKLSLTHGIDGGVIYSFTVVAVNRMGRSPPSKPLLIPTPVRAPEKIRPDQVHVDVLNSTVATVTWSRPSPSNGPISSYSVEVSLMNEASSEIIRVWNVSRPGNETNMQVAVNCTGAKVVTRVRVTGVNRDNATYVGMWSEPENVTLCDNPASQLLQILIIGFSCAVGFIILAALIAHCARRSFVKKRKPLVISTPKRVYIPAVQDESNDRYAAQYVANDATRATHLTQSDQSEDSDETRSSSVEISSYTRVGQNGPVEAESLVEASDSDQLKGKHFESISDDALEDAASDVSTSVDRSHTAGGDPNVSPDTPRKYTELDMTKDAILSLDTHDIFDKQNLITKECHLTSDDFVLPDKLDNLDADNDITAASCSSDAIGSIDECDSVSDHRKIGSYDGSGVSGDGTSSSGGCYSPAEKPAWEIINSKAASIDPDNPVVRCFDVVAMPINEKIVTDVAGCPPHRDVSDRLDSVALDDRSSASHLIVDDSGKLRNHDADNDNVASAECKPNADETVSESDDGKVGYGRQDGSSYDASGTSSSGGCYSPEAAAWQNINGTAASIDPNNPVTC